MNWTRKLHKWASAMVGLQFLIWLGSGMYFNFMDHDKAAGHSHRAHHQAAQGWSGQTLVEPALVLANFPPSTELKLIWLNSQPYYLLNHQRGLYANFANSHSLVDALSGRAVTLDQRWATELATASYSGPGAVQSAELLQPPLEELPKEQNPLWRVNFDDPLHTSVYIDAASGRVAAHVDDDKRLADFFLMLHFMDYGNQGSFNTPLMTLFAFVTLWLAGTGLIWSLDLARRGQYQLSWLGKKHQVKLFDCHQRCLGELGFSTHQNLLDGLVKHNIVLPSTCGGGGTCGRCKVLINATVTPTSADLQHFSVDELGQGYRLACQHFANDVEHMTLMDVTQAQRYSLTLTQATFISPFIKELRFKARTRQPLQYKAGAFMRFFIPAGQTQAVPADVPDAFRAAWQDVQNQSFSHPACTRNYSLASCPDCAELVFVIKLQKSPDGQLLPGIGSHYLGNLAVGDSIDALGPFEEFAAKPESSRSMVLIGAGSGMAPLKALLEEQLALAERQGQGLSRPVHFFYGARTEDDLIYWDYLYQLAKRHPRFHYYPVLSKAAHGWLGATGYAQHVLELNWDSLGPVDGLEFYLCGPKGLMADTLTILQQRGVKAENIAFDVFS
ncbi:2Fe-2S iron-sulfur cluster-binding protein [Rheinheimera sp.]|uniref:2Fe-2S iron-sulfur cluster-binding protein n=1 Tax=Rheinheimera sp. TaxID=1869214 RepID=UPI00307D67DB